MSKLIFSILTQFFFRRQRDSALSAQAMFLNAVTTALKKEISGLILKIALGLVATGVLIYSLITLGQHFQTFILKYEYGTEFSVLFNILLSAGCIFAVFKLFYEKKEPVDPFGSLFSKGGNKNFSFEKIYANFMDGLSAGMSEVQSEKSASHKKTEEKTEETTETEYKHRGMTH